MHTMSLWHGSPLSLTCDGDLAKIRHDWPSSLTNAEPILPVMTFLYPMVEAGICPCVRATYEQVLYRIIVNVVDVMNHVVFIADAVFPEPLLPNPAFPMLATRGADGCFVAMVSNPLLNKPPRDARPAGGEIAVVFGQGPYAMDMIRQQRDCDYVERLLGLYGANGGSQVSASRIIRKQVTPWRRDNGEEERASRLKLSAVVGHNIWRLRIIPLRDNEVASV